MDTTSRFSHPLLDWSPEVAGKVDKYRVLRDAPDAEIVNAFWAYMRDTLPSMQAAARNKQWAEVARLAHSLKGVGGSVGYPELSAFAECLEGAGKSGRAQELTTGVDALTAWFSSLNPPQ